MMGRLRHAAGQGLTNVIMRRWSAKGDYLPAFVIDPAVADNPYPWYAKIRSEAEFHFGASGVGIATTHELVEAVYRDPRWGHTEPDAPIPFWARLIDNTDFDGLVHPVAPPSMIAVNPPDHTRYRRLVSRAFTVKTVENLRPRVRDIADELLDAMLSKEKPDLMTDFAGVLPVMVIAEMLGVDPAMHADFKAWGYDVAQTLDATMTYEQSRAAHRSLTELNRYFTEAFEQRKVEPRQDLLTALLQAEVEGERLTHRELLATALILLVAGFETTVNLIGNGAALLLAHPEQRAALVADAALWPDAIEEILRYDSPIQGTSRIALEDLELEGHHLKAGTSAMLMIGSANRDPLKFVDPDVFDIRRANAREHVAFASGIHFCIGAALARVEGQVALQQLFTRLPHLRVAGPPKRRGSSLLRGYREFPVAVA